MASVHDVTRPDSDIPPLWTDYTGVKSGYMGITSKRMTGIDRIVAGRIELPVGFVSDSDVIETPICNQMKRVVRYRDSCVLSLDGTDTGTL
ncbi:polyhydroxyalkanoate synthase [Cutibacterium acnes]|uniref:polyhydroxyalkanoate synthase n=1 Tax=Cutibacterium acnes TaxID=1747 RepID=UPI0021B5CD24|nr:polyhydroxyalkanoate synthase [Cutibacterium acnes]